MTWNKNLPTGATKIRLSPPIFVANWNAIEDGDVPYVKLQLSEQAVDPTRQDNTGWLYTKQASSQTELFYEDDRNPAKAIQISNDGGIGITSQILYGSAIITSGTYQNTQDAFCSAWGLVSSAGALTAGYKVSGASQISTGLYEVTFSPALSSASYSIVAVARDSSSPNHNRVAMVVQQLAGSARIRTQRIDQSGGSFEDATFMFAVFGGR